MRHRFHQSQPIDLLDVGDAGAVVLVLGATTPGMASVAAEEAWLKTELTTDDTELDAALATEEIDEADDAALEAAAVTSLETELTTDDATDAT